MAREDGEPTGSPTGSPPPPKYKSLNEILSAVTEKQEPRSKVSRAAAHGEAMKDKNRHKQGKLTTAHGRPMARKPGSSKATKYDSDDESQSRSSRRQSSSNDKVVFGTCVFIPEGPKAFIGTANPPSTALCLEAMQNGFCVTASAEGDFAIARDSTYHELKETLRDIIPVPFEAVDKAIDARLDEGATEKELRLLGMFKLLNKEGRKLTLINIAEPTGAQAANAITKSSSWRMRTLYIVAPFDITEWCPEGTLTYLPCRYPYTREDALQAQGLNTAIADTASNGSDDERRIRKGKSKRMRSESPDFLGNSSRERTRPLPKRVRRLSPAPAGSSKIHGRRPSGSKVDTIVIHDTDSDQEHSGRIEADGAANAGAKPAATNEDFAELDVFLRSTRPPAGPSSATPSTSAVTAPSLDMPIFDSTFAFLPNSLSNITPSPVVPNLDAPAPTLPTTSSTIPPASTSTSTTTVPSTPAMPYAVTTGFGFGSPPKSRDWLNEF